MALTTNLAKLLLIVGGANWGFIGLTGVDMIAAFLGEMTAASRTAYVLAGMGAIWLLILMLSDALLGPYGPGDIVH